MDSNTEFGWDYLLQHFSTNCISSWSIIYHFLKTIFYQSVKLLIVDTYIEAFNYRLAWHWQWTFLVHYEKGEKSCSEPCDMHDFFLLFTKLRNLQTSETKYWHCRDLEIQKIFFNKYSKFDLSGSVFPKWYKYLIALFEIFSQNLQGPSNKVQGRRKRNLKSLSKVLK